MFVISQDGFNAVNVNEVVQFYVDELSMAGTFVITAYMKDNTKIRMGSYKSQDCAARAIGIACEAFEKNGVSQFLQEDDVFRMEVPFE